VLKQIAILRERIEGRDTYPFSVPAIRTLRELKLRSRICFFAGENGSGKSTLLEALAAHYGFGREGGTRNFRLDTTESNHSNRPAGEGAAIVVRRSYRRRVLSAR